MWLKGEHGRREVRALIDTGSQRWYILKITVEQMVYSPKKVERIIHGLFGGIQSEQIHHCYDIRLSKGTY